MRRDLKGEDIVKFRLEVMEFSDKYGVESAKEAFGVSRSTVFGFYSQTIWEIS
ncbi:hypothetical protein H5T88_08650 [bacterium]|nr:hypothetical protein [bacterium]